MKKLNEIQQKLNAPKNLYNAFGKYNHRSCEGILEAVKPLLGDDATLTLSDEIFVLGHPLAGKHITTMQNGSIVERDIDIGTKMYVTATVTLRCGDEVETAKASAREPLEKKGMDASQITGTASSYARKYALCGLFCIDDTKDADSTNTHGKDKEKKVVEPQESIFAPYVKATGLDEDVVKARLKKIGIDSPAKLKKANVEDTTIILKECK